MCDYQFCAAGMLAVIKAEPLTDKEKTLIDKAVFDKKNLKSDEQKELKVLSEKKEAEHTRPEEASMGNERLDQEITAKPSKDFP